MSESKQPSDVSLSVEAALMTITIVVGICVSLLAAKATWVVASGMDADSPGGARVFYVWHERDEDRGSATAIDAATEELAAVQYGEEDADGHADGIYFQEAQPIIVEDENGARQRFLVEAEPSIDVDAIKACDQSGLEG